MKARALELHIEELVFHGFEPASHRQIGDALQEELTRLFAHADTEAFGHDASVERLTGTSIPVSAQPHVLGNDIARSVHRALMEQKQERST